MSEWKQKRFWTDVSVEKDEDGYSVALDGRRIKTPAKAPLILPARPMAEAVADEWAAQEGEIDPRRMPFTRSANAAIDKVRTQHGEVADLLADYGDSDLLCYRADRPQELVERQAEAWGPALDWAEQALGVRLEPRSGVIHRPQDPEALARLRAQVHALDAFRLAAFHDLVSLTGSLILGFAAARDWRPVDALWALSRLDEHWQEEQWGADDEAAAIEALKRDAFLHAKAFYDFA
ncbi:ATP12 family chaperone protein [Antarcticimicrobium luteum]|uniref:ATPase n=1 Tax=Antarcticimicrobium luteum TaxID=2547397 RepID=A0A4R5UXP1_9RHOB|nr:ATP12 family protein [Antarcticimicrobium luteum]TDK43895.1 ATPase [Antarcticimicrobium luteum]